MKRLHMISGILIMPIFIISLCKLIFISNGLITFIISLIWLVVSTIKAHKCSNDKTTSTDKFLIPRVICSLILLYSAVMTITPFKSKLAYQYFIQKNYISRFGYNTEMLPESLPKNTHNYKIDFSPSILQSSGYISVSFYTSEENINNYISKYDYISEMTLSDNTDDVSKYTKEFLDAKVNDVHFYIIYDNNDFNHHRTTAINVDYTTNRIEFFIV